MAFFSILVAAAAGGPLTEPQARHLLRAYEEAIEMLGTGLPAAALPERALAGAPAGPGDGGRAGRTED